MPSKPKTTRIVLRVEVEVDTAEYQLAYGVPPEEQADDLANHVGGGITVGAGGEVTHCVYWRRLAR